MSNVHETMDLNLLRVVDAVLAEGSATAAARRLGVTQSAVSHALGRAREALGDPIVVRGRLGLTPTARGEALREPVRRALAELELALAPAELDPATWTGELAVAAPDYAAQLVLPAVAGRLAVELPGLDLVVKGPVDDPVRALAEGSIDLVIGRGGLEDAEGVFAQRLFDDGFVCLLRAGHPALDRPFDLDAFCALRHVLIAPGRTPGGIVDTWLAAEGRRRRVAVRVAHFLAAAWFVASSDAVCTLPRRVGLAQAGPLGLVALEPPLPVPGFTIAQHWHLRTHHHPAHRLLRRSVATACAHLRG